MKHLKNYKIFESSSGDIIQDVNDILQELVDENWVIDLEYTPKKWGNNIVINENISVLIKKKQNESLNFFPEGSLFKFSEVFEYVQRILDYFQTTIKGILRYEVSLCEYCYYDAHSYPEYPEKGQWKGSMDSDFTDLDDKKILAINIKIYLENLKTYEGFFDFLKPSNKKIPIAVNNRDFFLSKFNDVEDCFIDICSDYNLDLSPSITNTYIIIWVGNSNIPTSTDKFINMEDLIETLIFTDSYIKDLGLKINQLRLSVINETLVSFNIKEITFESVESLVKSVENAKRFNNDTKPVINFKLIIDKI